MSRAVRTFRAGSDAIIATWRKTIQDLHRRGRKIAIWGGGSKCVAFLTTLKLNSEIEYVVDINPHKWGAYLPGTGHKTVSPKALAACRPDQVIVMNPIYQKEILNELETLGLRAELMPV